MGNSKNKPNCQSQAWQTRKTPGSQEGKEENPLPGNLRRTQVPDRRKMLGGVPRVASEDQEPLHHQKKDSRWVEREQETVATWLCGAPVLLGS